MAKKGRKGKSKGEQRARAPERDPDAAPAQLPEGAPARAVAREHGTRALSAVPAGAETGVPASRIWTNAFIALFLAFNLAMPLRYYLGGGGYDERFSWRMFSTLRMQKCGVRFEETVGAETRPVDLRKTVQVAWIGMLERYRRPVVDKLLSRRCAQAEARSVRYERTCQDTDGSALPATTVTLDCKTGTFTADGGTP